MELKEYASEVDVDFVRKVGFQNRQNSEYPAVMLNDVQYVMSTTEAGCWHECAAPSLTSESVLRLQQQQMSCRWCER